MDFLETNEIIDLGQHRSRTGRSTLSQLLQHHFNIIQGLYDGSNRVVVYVDFSKSFDKVEHGILVHKLWDLGITGDLGA